MKQYVSRMQMKPIRVSQVGGQVTKSIKETFTNFSEQEFQSLPHLSPPFFKSKREPFALQSQPLESLSTYIALCKESGWYLNCKQKDGNSLDNFTQITKNGLMIRPRITRYIQILSYNQSIESSLFSLSTIIMTIFRLSFDSYLLIFLLQQAK